MASRCGSSPRARRAACGSSGWARSWWSESRKPRAEATLADVPSRLAETFDRAVKPLDRLAGRCRLVRAGKRLRALEVLMAEESWADVVCEAQEIVEITLKALLRACQIEAPRIHDMSPVLQQNRELLPRGVLGELDELARISKALRRDREPAFYDSEDLTPSEFYTRQDAAMALADAKRVHQTVHRVMTTE